MSSTSLELSPPNCPKFFHPVTHIIFDMDGTLIDTETINHRLWQKLVEKFGKSLPSDFVKRFRGCPLLHTVKSLIEELEIDSTVEEMRESLLTIEEGIFDSNPLQLMPGVARLIKHFYRHRVPMAIGTSSTHRQVEAKRKGHEKYFNMIHHVVTSDDVLSGKPAPDIYLLAAKKFCTKPKNSSCLTFEDTENGLKAALAAGMQCVFIPETEVDEEVRKRATLTLKSMEDFEPELFGLPPIGKRKALKYIGE